MLHLWLNTGDLIYMMIRYTIIWKGNCACDNYTVPNIESGAQNQSKSSDQDEEAQETIAKSSNVTKC